MAQRDYTNNTNEGMVLSEAQACRIVANAEQMFERGLLTQREFDNLKSETLVRTVPTLAILGMLSKHADHLDTVHYAEPTDEEMERVYGIARGEDGSVTHGFFVEPSAPEYAGLVTALRSI